MKGKQEAIENNIVDLTKKTMRRVYFRIVGVEVLVTVFNTMVVIAGFVAFATLFFGGSNAAVLSGDGLSVTGQMISGGIIIGVIAMVLMIFISLFSYVAGLSVLVRNVSFKRSLKEGFRKWYKLIPVSALLFFLHSVSVVSLLLIALGVLVMFVNLGGLLLSISGLLLMPVAVYLLVRAVLAYFVWAENQKMRARKVIKTSFHLIRGRIFWIALVISFFIGIATSAVSLFNSESVGMILFATIVSLAIIKPISWSLLYALYESAKKVAPRMKK